MRLPCARLIPFSLEKNATSPDSSSIPAAMDASHGHEEGGAGEVLDAIGFKLNGTTRRAAVCLCTPIALRPSSPDYRRTYRPDHVIEHFHFVLDAYLRPFERLF